MRIAKRWDVRRREYEEYILPWKASLYRPSMMDIVQCAACGREVMFGDTYTSRLIHDHMGFGYGVCNECYEKEHEELVQR